jgi:predicted  nucleic acid-binding Zn-ribbon protein
VRTTLEHTIEQTRQEHRQEVEKLKNQVVQLEEDIELWKERNIKLQNENSGLN